MSLHSEVRVTRCTLQWSTVHWYHREWNLELAISWHHPPLLLLYCTVLYCTVLYCTVLYCTFAVLYCTVLYCTVLYYTILYCTTVLYCTILYCTTVLYCTLPHCIQPLCPDIVSWQCVQTLRPDIVSRHCVCKLNVCSLLLGCKSRGVGSRGPKGPSMWPKATSPPQELEVGAHRALYLLVSYTLHLGWQQTFHYWTMLVVYI